MSAPVGLLAVTRFGLGPRPGDIAALGGDPRAALLAMTERPEATLIRDAPVPDPHSELSACYAWKVRRRELIAGGIDATTDEGRR